MCFFVFYQVPLMQAFVNTFGLVADTQHLKLGKKARSKCPSTVSKNRCKPNHWLSTKHDVQLRLSTFAPHLVPKIRPGADSTCPSCGAARLVNQRASTRGRRCKCCGREPAASNTLVVASKHSRRISARWRSCVNVNGKLANIADTLVLSNSL